ncbi:MAG: hypothetical protein MK132_00090 [Lentisphaerales bacterium]|nr:hypothetical protein [Lentisphaerales bacterium]
MKGFSVKKFTLVKLLVVTAVIGVLMTLLIPSFRDARVVIITAVSISNLKQLYTGSMLYAKSNSNFLFKPNNNHHEEIGSDAINFSRIVYEAIQGRAFGRT